MVQENIENAFVVDLQEVQLITEQSVFLFYDECPQAAEYKVVHILFYSSKPNKQILITLLIHFRL